jgi:uncharacterized protein YfaP (DUF2135 family)
MTGTTGWLRPGAALLVLLLAALACGGGGGGGSSPARPATPVIAAPAAAAAGATGLGATVPAQSGATFAWTISNGTIQAGADTRSITFTAGSAGTLSLTCTASTSAGASDPGACSLTVVAAPAAAAFTPGTRTTLATATIGATGGTISGPAGSPLAGVSATFPAGALPSSQTVTLGCDAGTLIPLHGTHSGTTIVLDAGQVTDFDQPVAITIPYDPAAGLPVPYTLDDAGLLQACQLVELDAVSGRAVFQTLHATPFTWIRDLPGLGDTFQAPFNPATEGFQVVNHGSLYNRDGECMGMTAFALWYAISHPFGEDFYPRFMTQVGTDAAGSPRVGQQVIATRAFISIGRVWDTYLPADWGGQLLTDAQAYRIIRNVLRNTGYPVLIALRKSANSGDGHSVLAIGWNDGGLQVYNPNNPGETQTVPFNPGTGVLGPYAGYDIVRYCGNGSFRCSESFAHILADAEAGFHGSANATLTVTSHASGATVGDRVQQLAGTITSGQVLVSRLSVFVNSMEFKTDVDAGGAFNLTVTLAAGTNHLLFVPRGLDADDHLINLPSNMDVVDFTLVADVSPAVILTTLTWDTNDTDVDTYVIDPMGDYSCYYHKTTADGGTLDWDVTSGYGPEHWLLTTANTVRWGGDYRVRLHYYSDHGRGPTNYTLAVQLYDGAAAVTWTYRGNLSVSDPGNDDCTATGPDWADVATVVPMHVAGAASCVPQFDGSLRITVPVPPAGARIKP